MTAIGFVFFVFGFGGMLVMQLADPRGWKLRPWSDVWACLFIAGLVLLILGIAEIIWEVMP